jgi:hypothetical protein
MFMSLLLTDRTTEEVAKAFSNISKNEVETENEHQLFILLHFLLGIEESAKAQGYIIKEGMPDLPKDS